MSSVTSPSSSPIVCLGLLLPPISAIGQGPSYTTEEPGIPLLVPSTLDPQSSLAQGEEMLLS